MKPMFQSLKARNELRSGNNKVSTREKEYSEPLELIFITIISEFGPWKIRWMSWIEAIALHYEIERNRKEITEYQLFHHKIWEKMKSSIILEHWIQMISNTHERKCLSFRIMASKESPSAHIYTIYIRHQKLLLDWFCFKAN